MKTLEELNRLRERVRQDIRIRQQTDTRIIILLYILLHL